MKTWQIVVVVVALISSAAIGYAAQSMAMGLHYTSASFNHAGSEGWNIANIPLNPEFGPYYQCTVTSIDGQPLNVLFMNETELSKARTNASYTYVPERSALNITSITLEGQLPGGGEVYELMVVPAEPGTYVEFAGNGRQGSFQPALESVLQVVHLICWISNIFLFFLLVHVWSEYRAGRKHRL